MAGKRRLTKRAVDALSTEKPVDVVWDADVPGFGVRVFLSGTKTFVLQYRSRRTGKTQTQKLGRYGDVTVEQARRKAVELRGRIVEGQDPAAALASDRAAWTVDRLAERWFAEHVTRTLKPRTQEEYARTYRRHIRGDLGPLKLKDVTLDDVERVLQAHGDRTRQSNRTRALLHTLFEYADKLGHLPSGKNPVRHATRHKEKGRERTMTPQDLARLEDAIDRAEASKSITPYMATAFRLLVQTGARLNEIRTLRWDYIRGDIAYLPDSKTGAKSLYLSEQALDILDRVPRSANNPYVCQGDEPGKPVVNLQKPWRRLRADAGLHDLRIHDLRHNFCTVLANSGMPIQDVQRLVGHKQIATTMRYVHMNEDAMRSAARDAGKLLAARARPQGPQPPSPRLKLISRDSG